MKLFRGVATATTFALALHDASTVTTAFVPTPHRHHHRHHHRVALSVPRLHLRLRMASTNNLDGKTIEGDFVPINNMLLVKKADTIDTTTGGIILTGKQKITKSEGMVVSVGPGRTNLETGYQTPMPVSPGETVLFGQYDGTEITYNGAKHTLIRDDDVLVKFPPRKDDDDDDEGGEGGIIMDLESAEVIWDSVLVRIPKVEEEKSSSGILFAKTTTKKKKSSVGEVVKVGPGRFAYNGVLMEMDVDIGDMIKFRDFTAQEVEIGGETYAVVRMTDVLAKF